MNINYPETIITKSNGSTRSESYLSKLCDRTFLSLWSYPNVFRDQGRVKTPDGQITGDGKELCDLLVVFGNHIIIFSDKDCFFSNTSDTETAWIRWYKRAIYNAAKQISGAERWLFDFNDLIYIDEKCTQRFPITIPTRNNAHIHRIVIAHGASMKCSELFKGASGSLVINNEIVGKQHYDNRICKVKPFQIGMIIPEKGFVHVFDDVSLDIVMRNVDTITDFTEYLEEKETFLINQKHVIAAGEEELLALYLTSSDKNGLRSFKNYYNNQKYDSVVINEGTWQNYIQSDLYTQLKKANETSYFWDSLISKFLSHIVSGTSDFMYPSSIEAQETVFRVLAKESRFKRRVLSNIFIDLIRNNKDEQILFRSLLPNKKDDPVYLFVTLSSDIQKSNSEYSEFKRLILKSYAYRFIIQNESFKYIIGIAIDSKAHDNGEDLIYIDASKWTSEDYEEARIIEETLRESGLFGNRTLKKWTAYEYQNDIKTSTSICSGRERNIPCPCGSGKKYKKCCGRNT